MLIWLPLSTLPTYLYTTFLLYSIILLKSVHYIRHDVYDTHNIFMYGNCFVCCMHIGAKGIVYCIAFIYEMLCIYAWLFSLLLSCKRLFHAHHTQLFFAKIHTRIVCKNEALLCCCLYISTGTLYLVIYDIVLFLFSTIVRRVDTKYSSQHDYLLQRMFWVEGETCNKYNIIVKM